MSALPFNLEVKIPNVYIPIDTVFGGEVAKWTPHKMHT